MLSAIGTGQVDCTGPVKRGEKHISISLKIDDTQYRWITCSEVLSVSVSVVTGRCPDDCP